MCSLTGYKCLLLCACMYFQVQMNRWTSHSWFISVYVFPLAHGRGKGDENRRPFICGVGTGFCSQSHLTENALTTHCSCNKVSGYDIMKEYMDWGIPIRRTWMMPATKAPQLRFLKSAGRVMYCVIGSLLSDSKSTGIRH